MAKRGFTQIGYLQNFREYPQMIRDKAGITYYDYAAFDAHIDSLWENRDTGIICFDKQGTEVAVGSSSITSFLIDTGFKAKDSSAVLFAGFQRNAPGSLDDPGWLGVRIGTRDDLAPQSLAISADGGSALRHYTSVGSYSAIARIINELTGKHISPEECENLLQKSFDIACETGTLAVVANQYDSKKQISFFPINDWETTDGVQLFVKMEKNKSTTRSTEWFGAFIVTKEELKEELLSYFCFHVGNFVFDSLAQANSFYNTLAKKAMRENWKWSDESRNDYYSQPILKSYLEYTYYRLLEEDVQSTTDEKKIVAYGGKVYFNSGLLDRNFRQIIIVGNEEILEKEIPGMGLCRWNLLSNINPYSHNEHEIARMFREDELPTIASYFTDYRQVVFDASLDIHTNDNHIFEDGVARGRLPKYQAEYDQVKDDDVERELLLTRIARDFDSARERAKLMAERNYKLAVPQFYKETGEIQFLLPIYLGEREEAEKPQCALVLSLDKTGRRPYYRGETILTLDMAYNNTRLIAKPDVFWLNDLV